MTHSSQSMTHESEDGPERPESAPPPFSESFHDLFEDSELNELSDLRPLTTGYEGPFSPSWHRRICQGPLLWRCPQHNCLYSADFPDDQMKRAEQQMHKSLCHGDWTCSQCPCKTVSGDELRAYALRLSLDSVMECVLPDYEEGFSNDDVLHSHEETAHQVNGNLITPCLHFSMLYCKML